MLRTQVQFTEAQLAALKARAARLGISVSEVVRRAVDAWVGGGAAPSPDELRCRAIEAAGRFGSGVSDIADKHDEYLSDALGS